MLTMNYSKDSVRSARLVFTLLILDILLGPASPLGGVQVSLIVIMLMFAINWPQYLQHINPWRSLLLLSIILSTIYSFAKEFPDTVAISDQISLTSNEIIVENVKRCLYILIAAALYTTIVRVYLKYQGALRGRVDSVLVVACLIYLLFAALFKWSPDIFYYLKSIFFIVDVDVSGQIELENAGYLKRYSFILLDPNNAGYYILMISLFLIESASATKLQKLIAWMAAISAPLLNLSAGTLLALLGYMAVAMIFRSRDGGKGGQSPSLMPGRVLLLVTMVALSGVVLIYLTEISELISGVDLIARLTDPDYSSGGRLDKYFLTLSNEIPGLIGMGYVIIFDSEYFRPHSDHLRFIYSYGLLSYGLVLMIVARNIKNARSYLFAVPAIAAFTLNSLLDETRLLYTFVALLAIVNAELALRGKVSVPRPF
jgi:hypothetical protein